MSPGLTLDELGERHQEHRKVPGLDIGPYCVWCLSEWPCDARVLYEALLRKECATIRSA